jgi:hypothetical protein
MPKQFEFRIEGNEKDFVEFLKSNKIPYTRLPKVRSRIATSENTEMGIVNIKAKTAYINREILEGIAKIFLIPLTFEALERIWNWYKGRRKRKSPRLSVFYEGNLLDLDAKNKKILMSALKEASKKKTRSKRGKQK